MNNSIFTLLLPQGSVPRSAYSHSTFTYRSQDKRFMNSKIVFTNLPQNRKQLEKRVWKVHKKSNLYSFLFFQTWFNNHLLSPSPMLSQSILLNLDSFTSDYDEFLIRTTQPICSRETQSSHCTKQGQLPQTSDRREPKMRHIWEGSETEAKNR